MMDERYCHEINKRIISGNLPLERLYPVPFEREPRINRASGMIELFRSQENVSEITHLLDSMLANLGFESEELEKALSISETSLVLNTGYPSSALSTRGEAYKASSKLCPYVTPLDKGLCFAGCTDETKSWQHAVAFIVSVAQMQELHYGYTIDVDKIDMSTPIISLILQPWDANSNSLLKKLSPQEIDRLNLLHEKRMEIHAIAKKERLETEALAKETDNDWNLFLEMLFDRSKSEDHIIQEILDESLLPKEKLQLLTEFADSIREEHDGLAMIRGHQEDIERIYNSVIDRLNGAPDLSLVQTENGQPFGINNEIVYVAASHCDFNSFQIKYHQFRLDSENLERAIAFFSLANYCIQMTLGIKPENFIPSEGKPLPELVEVFFNTIDNFYNQHKDSIENLHFSRLQPDAVASSFHTTEKLYISSMEEEIYTTRKAILSELPEELEKKYNKYLSDLSSDTSEDLDEGLVLTVLKETLEEKAHQMPLAPEEVKETVVARQFVISLNVIYLFRSALNIVLEKPETYALKREEDIEKLKNKAKKLKRREEKIASNVYSEIDEENLNTEDLDTYRERTGIDAVFLSQIEKELANRNLFDAFRDDLERLFSLAEECNIEEMLEAKLHLRERLFCIDDSAWAEKYVEQFEKINEELCKFLVNVCRQNSMCFEEIRNNLCESLGPESVRLPKNAIDSLATAELLYKEYANEELAAQGFDYSGISALYYQAFEAAYNELIWRDYEKELTEILTKATDKSIYTKAFEGYLHSDNSMRKQYVNCNLKTNKIQQIKHSIMYKSFGNILMYSIQRKSSTTRKFCDYFVHKVGFPNRDSMYKDADFMRNLGEFVDVILNAAENRNNASHGGKIISIKQLDDDKRTVLSDLEAVRSDSIGLIQQLLFLISYSCKSL